MMANGKQTGFQYRHENTDEICVDHCMRSLTEPGGIARQVPRKGRSESGSPESREQQGRKASRLPQNPPADCRPAGIPPAENQHQATIAGPAGVCYDPPHSGYSAAWLARLTGGQEVVGSNPASPTHFVRNDLLETVPESSRSGTVSALTGLRIATADTKATASTASVH